MFASCSADKSIRVWDVRVKDRKSVIGVAGAHDADVNVLSWNNGTNYLLASGGDEGGIKVWDLRSFKGCVLVGSFYLFVQVFKSINVPHSQHEISRPNPCRCVLVAHRTNNVDRMAPNGRLLLRCLGSR